jgi:hypothetical protein
MTDPRRQFMEDILRHCADTRLQRLLDRLEEDEETGTLSRIPVLGADVSRNDVGVFAKLPFQDSSGTWRYGLFDASRCVLRAGREQPLDRPFLVSKRTWKRGDLRSRLPPDLERRRGDRKIHP